MPSRSVRNQALAAVGAFAAAVALLTATAPTSAAAGGYPTCTFYKTISSGGLNIKVPSTAAPSGTTTCNLVLNPNAKSDDAAVKVLQTSLKTCEGYSYLDVDGAYGPQTFLAVKALQSKYGLDADGYYGPQTRNAMKHAGSLGRCGRV
ncbi:MULTISPECIES: peptidoglycan-binding protein [Streptomyces]|uniref:Peptidoglycan-binding domain-containing protein n=1 Tax=Streptomyces glycanivorans TaxID=3033808 RepID=A0ABY9JG46_9ACTN|nr:MULTISPECIES: peptidoglycan-binding domain-containing protein [unclassified Streptomyces]WSQ79067.1 peptidoglycan-binding protein [Streptomyces sp. NBC_01213]WLQ65651.1 peptidoglycan-binding domain-containing protein [Streptomyces sp. Alt3]WSQ86436.1 peptidoglycan-binding protein [Streptomyces sp. NBC_01212]WSR07516.1 peptidoglycan-binding protein [Streptomyces sp. NBC_01208]WSR49730.1 peptidoglycan-binding protein [Streptomyces sp. NBC_01201]